MFKRNPDVHHINKQSKQLDVKVGKIAPKEGKQQFEIIIKPIQMILQNHLRYGYRTH